MNGQTPPGPGDSVYVRVPKVLLAYLLGIAAGALLASCIWLAVEHVGRAPGFWPIGGAFGLLVTGAAVAGLATHWSGSS